MIKDFGVPIKSYIEEPLSSLFLKYGIPLTNGESYVLGLETNEHEGDIVLSDFVDGNKYHDEIEFIENTYEDVMTYDEALDKEKWSELPREYLWKPLEDAGINKDSIVDIIGIAIFDPDFKKVYFVGYQVQGSFGMKAITYKVKE